MNVQIEKIVPDGFVFEKEQNLVHGTRNGMELLILPMVSEEQFRVQLYADVNSSSEKENFLRYLSTLQQRYSFVQFAGFNGVDMVSVHVSSEAQADKENLTLVVSELASECERCGIHNCCSYCRRALPERAAVVDQVPSVICRECEQQLSGHTEGKKENLPLGVIGAIIGALVGSVLWVVLGQVGFIAGIAGYVIVFCGMKGYEFLGKELSKTGIVLCVILSFLMIIGAEMTSLAITIYREWGRMYAPTIGAAFSWIPELMQESELALAVAKDLGIGYLHEIWASYSSVKNIWNQVAEKQKVHTIERF